MVNYEPQEVREALELMEHDGSVQSLKELCRSKGADILHVRHRFNGSTMLHEAALWGRLEALKWMTSIGGGHHDLSNIGNIVDKSGNTVLHAACIGGHAHVVQWLLEEWKMDVNAGNHRGVTPLHVACHQLDIDVVKILLSHPDIDVHRRIVKNSGLLKQGFNCLQCVEIGTTPETASLANEITRLILEAGKLFSTGDY